MIKDWHSSVRTRYKILDNEAHSEDKRIATWYLIPWINIQQHLHPERFCQLFLANTPFMHLFSLHTLSGFMRPMHSKYTDGFEWRKVCGS